MPYWPSFRTLSKVPVEVFVWTEKCGYGSPSAAPVAQLRSAFSEMPPLSHSSAPALEEVGESADKGNCCPQSVAGETERGTGSNLRSEPRHLPLAEGTHKSWEHACTHVHSAMATPLPQHRLCHRNRVTELPMWALYSHFSIFIHQNSCILENL